MKHFDYRKSECDSDIIFTYLLLVVLQVFQYFQDEGMA